MLRISVLLRNPSVLAGMCISLVLPGCVSDADYDQRQLETTKSRMRLICSTLSNNPEFILPAENQGLAVLVSANLISNELGVRDAWKQPMKLQVSRSGELQIFSAGAENTGSLSYRCKE